MKIKSAAYKHKPSGIIKTAPTHCQAIYKFLDINPLIPDSEFEMGYMDENNNFIEYDKQNGS